MTLDDRSLPVFALDELQILEVQPAWSAKELLEQTGIFFLKDITELLRIDSTQIKKIARTMMENGDSPWELMGARKVWSHWLIRMKVFAPYYREHLFSTVRNLDPHWDGNQLLKEKGVFYLTDVCRLIPFSAHQIRYQVKRNPSSREDFGVWKDENSSSYLVEMEKFAVWIREIWIAERLEVKNTSRHPGTSGLQKPIGFQANRT